MRDYTKAVAFELYSIYNRPLLCIHILFFLLGDRLEDAMDMDKGHCAEKHEFCSTMATLNGMCTCESMLLMTYESHDEVHPASWLKLFPLLLEGLPIDYFGYRSDIGVGTQKTQKWTFLLRADRDCTIDDEAKRRLDHSTSPLEEGVDGLDSDLWKLFEGMKCHVGCCALTVFETVFPLYLRGGKFAIVGDRKLCRNVGQGIQSGMSVLLDMLGESLE